MSQLLASPHTAGMATPDAWIAAQGAMAADLATFQALRPTARSHDLTDVVEAMSDAFRLGFAYSLASTASELTVTLLHRSGWDMSSSVSVEGLAGGGAGQLLADLLGIRVGDDAAIAQLKPVAAEPACPMPEPACPIPAPAPVVPFEVEDEPDEFAQESVPAELLAELSESDRKTCIALIKGLKPDERKSFTIAFRSHFQVPREERSITPFICQVQHQRFVQSFIDELELQQLGVAA